MHINFYMTANLPKYRTNTQRSIDTLVSNLHTEEKPARAESVRILDTVDLDDLDVLEAASLVCYYIVGGDTRLSFELNRISHLLVVSCARLLGFDATSGVRLTVF